MSEPIPESIPTSADPRSRRTTKKARLTGPQADAAAQAASIESLFAHPERDVSVTLKGPSTKSSVGPPPEIVANVQGSSAGAGSGEFHVYKASRRREYDRLKEMEEEVKREKDLEAWEKEKLERERLDEERTRKRREKRMKKGKGKGKGGATTAPGASQSKSGNANGNKRDADNGDEQSNEGTPVVEEVGLTIHDDD